MLVLLPGQTEDAQLAQSIIIDSNSFDAKGELNIDSLL
jgi:hypothetical protein